MSRQDGLILLVATAGAMCCARAIPPFAGTSDTYWRAMAPVAFSGPPTEVIAAVAANAKAHGCGAQRMDDSSRSWTGSGSMEKGGSSPGDQWQSALVTCSDYAMAVAITSDGKIVVGCERPTTESECIARFRKFTTAAADD